MSFTGVNFSIAAHAAWAPGIETPEAWLAWADSTFAPSGPNEPGVRAMPAMLRRRAAFLGKMALAVAYQCLGERKAVATIFCSRHGEVSRSVELLSDLARGEPLSPTSFGMSVHNAIGGLFSIARSDQANNSALAAGASGIEHAVIEACGLLADGEQEVLLVAYDSPLPGIYENFQQDCEQPHAWAWLMQTPGTAPATDVISLSWSAAAAPDDAPVRAMPAGLEVLRFHLRQDRVLQRICDGRLWQWSRHV